MKTPHHNETKKSPLHKNMGDCLSRNLISIPLVSKHAHQTLQSNSGLRIATLEFDTAAYPNIEYIAGTRMSVYPVNSIEEVDKILNKLVDDLSPNYHPTKPANSSSSASAKTVKLDDSIHKFYTCYESSSKDGLKQCLLHLFDISSAPTIQVLQVIGQEFYKSKSAKDSLVDICKSTESYERWLLANDKKTIRGALDEYSNGQVLASNLLAVLPQIDPRLYSISSIKSTKRFRTEIIVVQHKFSNSQISATTNYKRFKEQIALYSPSSDLGSVASKQSSQIGSKKSISSLRSVGPAISTHQIKRVHSFSGPLMSQYTSTVGISTMSNASQQQKAPEIIPHVNQNSSKPYNGLCSNYLLDLKSGESVTCEFIENPRFTLKGNRERPIMMIGQDIGLVSFRAFWQQRNLEHDRAQVFYTLFKDLSPKKFGEMHFVALTGSKLKIEDLFKREVRIMQTSKVLTSVTYIDRSLLIHLLNEATDVNKNSSTSRASSLNSSPRPKNIKIESKVLSDLGIKIAKLLSEHNGCLYTACDPQITQALEILLIESLVTLQKSSREKIVGLLPKLKGRRGSDGSKDGNFTFTIENPYERAQIVQEVYESSF